MSWLDKLRELRRKLSSRPPPPDTLPAAKGSREDDATDVTRLYDAMKSAAGQAEQAAARTERAAERASTRMSKESYDRIVAALNDDDD